MAYWAVSALACLLFTELAVMLRKHIRARTIFFPILFLWDL